MDPDKKPGEKPDERDPLLSFGDVDDEDLRTQQLPDPELNKDPPEDKKPAERNPDGTFKGKDGEKKPEEKAADKDKKPEEKKEEKKEDFVPLAKFLDEKAKLKAELDQREITIKEFQKKLDEITAKLPKQQAEEPPEPDYIEDPKGYVDTRLAKALSTLEAANKKIEEQGKAATETANRARETAEMQGFMRNLQAHEARFVAEKPDYHDALQHMRDIRTYQLQQLNPEITPEQIHAAISQEEIGLAMHLARAGKDPVATVYAMAEKYGYKPKAAKGADDHAALVKKTLEDNSRRLPPDQSLGASSGATDLRDDSDQVTDPVQMALDSLKRARA